MTCRVGHRFVTGLGHLAADRIRLLAVLPLACRDLHRVALVAVFRFVDRPSALERDLLTDRVKDRLVDGELLGFPDSLLHLLVLGPAANPRRAVFVAGTAGLGRAGTITGRTAVPGSCRRTR